MDTQSSSTSQPLIDLAGFPPSSAKDAEGSTTVDNNMALLTVDERNFFLENDSFSRRAHIWTDLWCLLAAGVEEKADADAKEMSTPLNFMVAIIRS